MIDVTLNEEDFLKKLFIDLPRRIEVFIPTYSRGDTITLSQFKNFEKVRFNRYNNLFEENIEERVKMFKWLEKNVGDKWIWSVDVFDIYFIFLEESDATMFKLSFIQ